MPNESTAPSAEPRREQSPLLPSQYVAAERLLEVLFDEQSRPTLRWLRQQQVDRTIPFVKIGRLVFFDPAAVKASLDAKATRTMR